MKITEMVNKITNPKGTIKPRSLEEVVAGGSAEDFIQDGGIYKIIDQSQDGFYDERFGKNATFVIVEAAVQAADGKLTDTGDAVQYNLSAGDRAATPYRKEADGFTVRDGETVRADGDFVTAWKAAKNAKEFMKANNGRYFKAVVKAIVNVRAWDRAAEAYSKTDLREQKVFTLTWA